MTFYNRNNILYVSINGVRKSTKLEYNKNNIKKFKSFYNDEEFYNKFNINKLIPTLNELVENVLEDKAKYLKRNSFNSYLSLFDSRIKPFFKNKYITDVKSIDIYNFYNTFKDKSSLNTCLTLLKSAFDKAIIKGYIISSPVFTNRPVLKSSYKINPFTFKEADLIINFLPDPLKNLFGIAFYTGMRTGEILGLKWENVNFDNYSISIDSQFTNGFEDTPKTKSSIRVIDMISQAEHYLKQQRSITNDGYVFLNENNKPFTRVSHLYTTWKNILKALDLDYRSIYQTRHSFASNMLSNGENLLWVSKMLGHHNINITLQKYSKFIKEDNVRKITYLDK
jgi:integrase